MNRCDNQVNLRWDSLLQTRGGGKLLWNSPHLQIWECLAASSWGHPFTLLLTGPWAKPPAHPSSPSAWDDIICEAAVPFPPSEMTLSSASPISPPQSRKSALVPGPTSKTRTPLFRALWPASRSLGTLSVRVWGEAPAKTFVQTTTILVGQAPGLKLTHRQGVSTAWGSPEA